MNVNKPLEGIQLSTFNELLQQDNFHKNSNIIKNWWKKNNDIKELNKLFNIKLKLTPFNLQELSNNCKAITDKCNGAGLTGGGIVDMYLKTIMLNFILEKVI